MPSIFLPGAWRKPLLILLLYAGFALFYMLSLFLSYQATIDGTPSYQILYLDYPLKALFTLPVWYLIFRVLAHWSLEKKLLLNLLLMPVWIKGWQWTYYGIVDLLKSDDQTVHTEEWWNYFVDFSLGGHLEGPGEWWDVYIPGLFYVLQFGIFHAWDNYERLLREGREKAEVQRLALSSELVALKAQLNPHFLYNSLNTISASVGPGQEGTRQMIAQLSDLFRYQLAANRRQTVRLREELDFVRDYLQLETARFGDRLAFRFTVAEDAPVHGALIAPLLLQPLVENAVRHGLSPSIIGGEVIVSAEAANEELVITIFNTGQPVNPAHLVNPTGYGLVNTRRRLQLLYGAPLALYSDDDGTYCRFSIPLTYAPDHTPDRRRGARPQTAPRVPVGPL